MTKKYQKPKVEVIEMKAQPLLEDSGGGGGATGGWSREGKMPVEEP